MKCNVKKLGPFVCYSADPSNDLDPLLSGKWMHFFKDREWIAGRCREAVERGVVGMAKHSDAESGVACFCVNSDDYEGHRRILSYFVEHGMVRKAKDGRLNDISFKYDKGTKGRSYEEDYDDEIKLSDFVDLETGEILD